MVRCHVHSAIEVSPDPRYPKEKWTRRTELKTQTGLSALALRVSTVPRLWWLHLPHNLRIIFNKCRWRISEDTTSKWRYSSVFCSVPLAMSAQWTKPARNGAKRRFWEETSFVHTPRAFSWRQFAVAFSSLRQPLTNLRTSLTNLKSSNSTQDVVLLSLENCQSGTVREALKNSCPPGEKTTWREFHTVKKQSPPWNVKIKLKTHLRNFILTVTR